MEENMMCKAHKSNSQKFRDNFAQTFRGDQGFWDATPRSNPACLDLGCPPLSELTRKALDCSQISDNVRGCGYKYNLKPPQHSFFGKKIKLRLYPGRG